MVVVGDPDRVPLLADEFLLKRKADRCRDAIELACRFGVDRPDTRGHRVLELVARLADAGEHDVLRRETRALGDADLAAGVRIRAAAE